MKTQSSVSKKNSWNKTIAKIVFDFMSVIGWYVEMFVA